MTHKLITIDVFTDLPTAHIAKGQLESSDIKCFLENESVHVANPLVFSEVKLKVKALDVPRALEILKK